MTQSGVPLIPLEHRPALAARLVRVWRLHHLARGEELCVIVMPGEWPDTFPAVAADDVPVKCDKVAGGPGGMMVLGKVGDRWRFAYTLACSLSAYVPLPELKLTTVYGEVSDDPDISIWMEPSPTTGEVPMWKMPRTPLR